MTYSLVQRLGAEFIGTGLLLTTVVGSGILADRFSQGNDALALMAHSFACGQILFVLIVMMSPISGAHFNPVVTLVMRLKGEISTRHALAFVAVQLVAALVGMLLAHMMFNEPVLQIGYKVRSGAGQWLGEAIATFGLILTIFRVRSRSLETVAGAIGLYIVAAIWFTASMCFANPAVTLARALTATWTSIQPADVPGFLIAQIAGGVLALLVDRFLFDKPRGADS